MKSIEERVGRKAMFGSLVRTQERQAATAELEAFKAAELAGTPEALRTFAANYPSGSLTPFVRDQIVQVAHELASRPARRSGATTSAQRPAVGPPMDIGSKRRLSLPIALSVAALVAIFLVAVSIGFYTYWDAARQADVVRVREQEQRAAAEARAGALEAQAAAERAARERADEQLAAEKRTRELEGRASADRAARERAETDRLAAEKRAQAAEAKLQLAQKSVAPAVTTDSGRPSADQSFAFAALSPGLRDAAQAARANAKRAEDKAYWARMAAEAAEAAAKRARAREPGTITFDLDGGTYWGEGRAPNTGESRGASREGSGVTIYRAPSEYVGDRYAGQYRDNARNGLGVYEYASNPKNTFQGLRCECEWAQNRSSLGLLTYRSGARFAGQWREGASRVPLSIPTPTAPATRVSGRPASTTDEACWFPPMAVF